MYINITEFVQNANELIFKESGTCQINDINSDLEFTENPNYDIMISKVDTELILNITVDYSYKKPCDRCLTEVFNSNSIDYSAKLINYDDSYMEDNLSDREDIVFMEQYKINICELVKELVILSIPMKNLCDDDCQGFCTKCGKNLNEGKCDCDTENIDFRFSVLKDFKIDEEV